VNHGQAKEALAKGQRRKFVKSINGEPGVIAMGGYYSTQSRLLYGFQ
jgi:hypothetical protein